MIISLVGYMGSGKSHISKVLSNDLHKKLIDLDEQISLENRMPIPEIFQNRGEIFFRKEEKRILEDILTYQKDAVLSVGGGTPVFYSNMDLLNQYSESIFLRTSVKTLNERLLKQKQKRPLISRIEDADLPEFVAKHLFERNLFYAKAKHIVDTDGKEISEVVDEIKNLF